MKIKLTPLGRFGKSLYFNNVVYIVKLPTVLPSVRIDYVDEKGYEQSKAVNLDKWSVLLYED